MTYVLDTSALIGAWQRKYPPEVFPSLWENLDQLGRDGGLFVPEEVLGGWCRTRVDGALLAAAAPIRGAR